MRGENIDNLIPPQTEAMPICNRCGKESHHTHHKDHNHKNNKPDNLENLCTLCHAKEHNIEPKLSELRLMVFHYKSAQKIKNQIKQTCQELKRVDINPDEKIDELGKEARLLEYYYERQIKRLLENDKLTQRMTSIKGIGYTMSGLILSEINWENTPTYASLWSYAGLSPEQKKRVGKKANWNHRLKSYCFQLVSCFIKARTPKYREIYDKEKDKQLKMDIKKAHAHNRSIRKVAKIFLRDLFFEMER